MNNQSPWAILGLGAIGKLWASFFLRNKQSVELLVRNTQTRSAFIENGLTLYEEKHNQHWPTPHVTTPDMDGGIFLNVLITTKTYQTLPALQDFAHRIQRHTNFVLLQNGLGVAEHIQTLFPDNPLFLAVTTDGAYCPSITQLVHAGRGDTWIGPAKTQQSLSDFVTLQKINPSCFWTDTINTRLWQKFAVNCAINGLTVLYQCQNGKLISQPELRVQLENLCQEIEHLLAAKAIQLPLPLIDTVLQVASQTAHNFSSMYQDFKAGRPLELEALNIYLCQQAQLLGLDCPHNEALVSHIRQMEISRASQNAPV